MALLMAVETTSISWFYLVVLCKILNLYYQLLKQIFNSLFTGCIFLSLLSVFGTILVYAVSSTLLHSVSGFDLAYILFITVITLVLAGFRAISTSHKLSHLFIIIRARCMLLPCLNEIHNMENCFVNVTWIFDVLHFASDFIVFKTIEEAPH